MAEGDAGQPIDADMDVGCRFLPSGNIQFAAARSTATDENRVIAFRQQRLHGTDALPQAQFRLKVENIVHFLVQHGFRQTEFGNLRSHHAACRGILIVENAGITEGQEIAGDGE